MKITFFGTGNFGLPALEAIQNSNHEVNLIVSPPNKPQGRGRKLIASPLELWAKENNITLQFEQDVNSADFLSRTNAIQTDLFLVVALGVKLGDTFLNQPRYGSINIHPSLLPQYRGASPIPQALWDGQSEVGTTIMRMGPRMDAGNILNQLSMTLSGDEDSRSVWDNLSLLSAKALMTTLEQIENKTLTEITQDETKATYCKKLSKADAIIDWNRSARQIHNQIRAFSIWPNTLTHLNGKKLKLIESEVLNESEANHKCGQVINVCKDGLDIQTGGGILRVLRLQIEGGKPMDTASFINGNPITNKTLFGI